MKLRAVNDNIVIKATASDNFDQQVLEAEVIETVEGISDQLQGKKILVARNKMTFEVPNSDEDAATDSGILLAAKTKTAVIKLADVQVIVEE